MLKDPKEMARREEEWKKMQEAAAANAAHATNQAAPETAKILSRRSTMMTISHRRRYLVRRARSCGRQQPLLTMGSGW